MARYDNLGKGASGAAVQCLGLMLGLALETRLAGAAGAAPAANDEARGFGETPPAAAEEGAPWTTTRQRPFRPGRSIPSRAGDPSSTLPPSWRRPRP